MYALLGGRVGDLGRSQADALIDDIHAGVAGAHRDLLGPVGVAVEAGLADEELDPATEGFADALDLLAHLGHVLAGDRGGLADPGRGAVLAKRVAQRLGPLAGASPRPGRRRSWPA